MDSERWRHIEEIFQAATELPPAKRGEYLAAACAVDESWRREVEILIDAHERAGNFIEDGSLLDDFVLPERRIGPYELIREIGRGGMGSVFLAARADEEFRQRVAIKLVHAGLDYEAIVRRFRNERQILAGLDHPNIARLLDGGTTTNGLPYFVMEYVEGEPIAAYCASRNLSTAARLRLFQAVSGAVHYAHQNLIVHRDIKPGNILVTAEGVPKLLDFGIAKLIPAEPAALDLTGRTSQLMTPQYASPEQVSSQPITTASDIYSLGVLLYELLTGQTPYRVAGCSPLEMAHAICQQEPAKPSALAPHLKGDLDNIILRAMQKEPRQRYGSVDQFLEDISRYLTGRPILAHAPTFRYRAGKFMRRHKGGVAAAGLVMTALAAGAATTLWQARAAMAQRARAEHRFNDVRRLANSFLFEFDDAIKDLPGSTTARSLIVKRALEYLGSLAAESRGDRSLQREMALAYEGVAEIQGNPILPNLGDSRGALESYRKALAIREGLVRAEPANDVWQRELAALYGQMSDLLMTTGDTAGAVSHSGESVKMYAALAKRFTAEAPFQNELVISTYKHAGHLEKQGKLEEALAGYRRAAELSRQMLSTNSPDPAGKIHLATSVDGVGSVLLQKGDTAGALENHNQALEIRQELVSTDPNNTHYRRQLGFAHHNIGLTLMERGELKRALHHFETELSLFEALRAADVHDAQAQRNVSLAHKQIGDTLSRNAEWRTALEHYSAALKIDRDLASAQPGNAQARLDLTFSEGKSGMALGKLGRSAEALELLRKGAAGQESLMGRDPHNDQLRGFLANSYTRLGECLAQNGNLDGALAYFDQARELRQDLAARQPGNSKNQDFLAQCYLNLAKTVAARDRERALKDALHAIELLDRLIASDAGNAQYRIDLAEANAYAARWSMETNNRRDARSYYLRSRELWAELERNGRVSAAERHWVRDVTRELADLTNP